MAVWIELVWEVIAVGSTRPLQEDVDAFMKEHNGQDVGAAEAVLKELDEKHGKYKYMESSMVHRKKRHVNHLCISQT